MIGFTGYGAKPTREELAKRLQAQIMGQPLPQTIGGGMGMLGAGLAANLAKRNAAFPTTPGGGQPSMMTGLANFFSGSRNGGLY
ncbi:MULTISPECIES: hypothetical protein [unclassified Sinorhizobium]|uniref:hypothetical protein n=1 Tax=unclassified Sinorhizobium TaxID=2613772 RepID=UPI0024C2D8D8|nr:MULTISPECIES: hypothetical protein [unclassified Sinorhizobium]MDK1377092.1 hypothetical protein [Sinorhizobium sp. 6-70]MDK1479613.1 hypothetical protein [Sinorhizobium sp. 6-117]